MTVTVSTLGLQNSSAGATPTGELIELFWFCMLEGLPTILQSWLRRVLKTLTVVKERMQFPLTIEDVLWDNNLQITNHKKNETPRLPLC